MINTCKYKHFYNLPFKFYDDAKKMFSDNDISFSIIANNNAICIYSDLTREEFMDRLEKFKVECSGDENLEKNVATKKEIEYRLEAAKLKVSLDKANKQINYLALINSLNKEVIDSKNKEMDALKYSNDKMKAEIENYKSEIARLNSTVNIQLVTIRNLYESINKLNKTEDEDRIQPKKIDENGVALDKIKAGDMVSISITGNNEKRPELISLLDAKVKVYNEKKKQEEEKKEKELKDREEHDRQIKELNISIINVIRNGHSEAIICLKNPLLDSVFKELKKNFKITDPYGCGVKGKCIHIKLD